VKKMIKKIVRLKTIGSRKTPDDPLRPDIDLIELFGQGVNLRVLEYDEEAKECVAVLFAFDDFQTGQKRTEGLLEKVKTHESFIEELSSHPKMPEKLASIGVTEGRAKYLGGNKVEVEGKTLTFLREEKRRDTAGREVRIFILDEG